MPNFRLGGRAVWASVAALACVSGTACDSVLDIEDPQMRPADAGEPGFGATAGKTGSSAGVPSTSPEGGVGGEGGRGGAAGAEPVVAGAGSGGEGGDVTVTQKDCETGSVRCAEKAPEVCDASGHWAPNEAEAEGDCAVQCQEGRCVACLADEKRCTVCEEGDVGCDPHQPQGCVDGAWKSEGAACKHHCDAGQCVTPPSCKGTEEDAQCASTSCCRSLLVPGGTFSRDYDNSENFPDAQLVATVSPFLLDEFEVTVGRMKRFVAAYPDPSLVQGKGKSGYIENDTGWLTAYELPPTAEHLTNQFKGCAGTTWTDNNEGDVTLPINCVPFNVAYAFCIWDGGRLPTETEWNFAAAGGSQQRSYPWRAPGSVGEPITPAHATYESTGPTPVGSKALGDGRWGHADLAGNVSEWTLDYYQEPLLPCNDCLNTAPTTDRVERGGHYASPADFLLVPFRGYGDSSQIVFERGFRCARELAQ
jgi:formylglycine-generating enzyme